MGKEKGREIPNNRVNPKAIDNKYNKQNYILDLVK